MYNEGRDNRRLHVASLAEDVPCVSFGRLIPKKGKHKKTYFNAKTGTVHRPHPASLVAFASLVFFASVGSAGYSVVQNNTQVASAISTTGSEVSFEDTIFEKVEPEAEAFIYKAKVEGLSAAHYLVADLENGSVIAASDLRGQAPIASLAKLATALVALKDISFEDRVVVSQERYVTTLIPRLSGSYKMSVQNLLQLLLVESSNEAAEVIASITGRDAFIARMNEKAQAIGLHDTIFADPAGLEDGNVSSVLDMFHLLQYIDKQQPSILEITAKDSNDAFGVLTNFNYIEDTNFIAGKVGETLAAGQTSASVHEITIEGKKRAIAIVLLGTHERSADTKKLIEYVHEHF